MSQHGCPERLSNRSKGFQEDGSGQATMEVLVETLTGTAFEMTVSPSDTIFAIKSKIFRVEGIPVSQQHLVYNLRELEDSLSLREHAIGDGARLRLVVGLRGGPVATRRLPPPEPWRDIERLLHSNRDESEWSGGGGSGCKVTVLVFREGERVNMVRVRENRDGTYSPLEHAKCSTESSSLTHLLETEPDDGLSGSLQENAVTMGKMLDLRRRMENLSVRRRQDRNGDKHDIQKTRSEETLSVPSLLDDAAADPFASRTYTPYCEEDSFAPLYDGHYTRYSYDCALGERYTLLPPLGARTQADAARAQDDERLLSDALAGSILVKARDGGDDDAAILEECLDGEDCMRQHPAKSLAPIPAAEYGPLVGGEAGGWRARAFGSSSQLAARGGGGACGAGGGTGGAAHARSASALHVRARAAPRPPPLSDALFCSSTSDLEKLKRNRILPALSRHRNREHLHLSDEGLDLTPPRGLEAVGSERRQRRIDKIAESEQPLAALPALPALSQRLYRYEDAAPSPPPAPTAPLAVPTPPVEAKEPVVEKQGAGAGAGGGAGAGAGASVRVRCGWCRRRLSIATEHACRCGGRFCAPHRYAEVHGCAFDYKALARASQPDPAAAALLAPKLPKI